MEAGIAPTPFDEFTPSATSSLEERLELGEVHLLGPQHPLALPSEADRAFLLDQELHRGKEIVFEPASNRLAGHRLRSTQQSEHLRNILQETQNEATRWLTDALPHYAGLTPMRTCFHVAEEATRCLRVTARYDLLHVDALHQSGGQRMLRVFVNLNPVDARVWASSETLAKILPKFGPKSGLIEAHQNRWPQRLGHEMLRLFRTDRTVLDPHDEFMLAFARYLKHSDEFQDKAPRKIWRFQPGQAWAAFTDSLAHADLRGRWVLDHLFLIPPDRCVRPELSPAELVRKLNPRTMPAAA